MATPRLVSILALLVACAPEPAPSAPTPWPGRLPLSRAHHDGATVVRAARGDELVLRVRSKVGFVERWEARPEGLEHAFTVSSPPTDGPLVLELVLEGADVVIGADRRSARLVGDHGTLHYTGLAAWDALGTPLVAVMEDTHDGLRLVVETAGAAPPVTVDPLLWGTSWEAFGVQSNELFGESVASAGDVNGDGHADVVVGSPGYWGADNDCGRASVWLGSTAGLAAAPTWTTDWYGPSSAFGHQVASAGDVDGDGFDDLLVGAYGLNDPVEDEGAVYLFRGSPTGPSAQPDWTFGTSQAEARVGSSVTSAGDVNGDGFDDVIVGAMGFDRTADDEGAALLFLGSAAGLPATPSWVAFGGADDANLGEAVASAGDVNGDGFDDVIVGAPDTSKGELEEGAAYVYLGSAAGLDLASAWSVEGGVPRASLGRVVASAGDVNGDGYDDVVVGGWDAGARLYLGSAAGLSAAPAWTVSGFPVSSAAGVGDVNGDGYGDVVVGSSTLQVPDFQEGAAFLYLGSAAGLSPTPAWTGEGQRQDALFGDSVAGAGDVDGDGRDDLVVGATHFGDWPLQAGAAFVYTEFLDADADGALDAGDGCPTTPDPLHQDTDADGVGDACDAPSLRLLGRPAVGATVTLVAGGVAPGELVRFYGSAGAGGVGPCAPALGGSCLALGAAAVPLGQAVAGPGGQASVRLVLPGSLVPDGVYVAQAVVPRGAETVVSPVVLVDGARLDWDADGLVDGLEVELGTDPTLYDTDGDGVTDAVEVATGNDPLLTDTDGDGVQDDLDLCWFRDDALDADGDGAADGCDTCATTANPAQVDADQDGIGDVCEGALPVGPVWSVVGKHPYAELGPLASAGDVNGDGYADVIVGSPGYDGAALQVGAVDVYLGSAAGLSTVAAWSVEGPQSDAGFGAVVASAGDVDGDGFDEILVAAPSHTGAASDTGAVWLYPGSPTGPSSVAAWTAAGTAAYENLGLAMAGAGDLNGDGFDDVVVTTGDATSVLVYLGSPAGLPPTPSVTLTSAEPVGLGASLAGAGDVNRDGFDDLVVGAPWAWDPELDTWVGQVWLYLGSAGGIGPVPASVVSGRRPEVSFGQVVAAAGDVNGDGFDDVLVGGEGQENDDYRSPDGLVAVFLGMATGLQPAPVWTGSARPQSSLGAAVAGAGDVNGDGFDDVVVGAPTFTQGQPQEGAVLVWLGSSSGLHDGASLLSEGGADLTWLGGSVAGAGDVNGDGLDDVLAGAQGFVDARGEVGAAVLFRGVR